MTSSSSNLRKAAVFIRSLDGETAATLLAQLSATESEALREAIRSLGPVDDVERDDIVADLRRARATRAGDGDAGVELQLTSPATDNLEIPTTSCKGSVKRFECLENPPAETVAARLLGEHAQTRAVVFAQMHPARAAEVLALLPAKAQAETVERMTRLGESDPDCLSTLERELAAWATRHAASRPKGYDGNNAASKILAAADNPIREQILVNLKRFDTRLATQLQPSSPSVRTPLPKSAAPLLPASDLRPLPPRVAEQIRPIGPPLSFNDIIHLSDLHLVELLRRLDAPVLHLALAGANEALVDRVVRHLPKPQAKALRRQVKQLGPTRLSDVERAQDVVTEAARAIVGRHYAVAATR